MVKLIVSSLVYLVVFCAFGVFGVVAAVYAGSFVAGFSTGVIASLTGVLTVALIMSPTFVAAFAVAHRAADAIYERLETLF